MLALSQQLASHLLRFENRGWLFPSFLTSRLRILWLPFPSAACQLFERRTCELHFLNWQHKVEIKPSRFLALLLRRLE
jgi:hypothetical protein